MKGEQISIAHDKTMCKEIYRSPGKNAKAAFFFHEDVCAAGGGMSESVNEKIIHTGRNVRKSGLAAKQHSFNVCAACGGMSERGDKYVKANTNFCKSSYHSKW